MKKTGLLHSGVPSAEVLADDTLYLPDHWCLLSVFFHVLDQLRANGAIKHTVGLLSSDIRRVSSFIGLRAFTTSSAHEMSDSVRVEISDTHFLTSGDSNPAQTAGCCSRNCSSILYVLFHLVMTSDFSL